MWLQKCIIKHKLHLYSACVWHRLPSSSSSLLVLQMPNSLTVNHCWCECLAFKLAVDELQLLTPRYHILDECSFNVEDRFRFPSIHVRRGGKWCRSKKPTGNDSKILCSTKIDAHKIKNKQPANKWFFSRAKKKEQSATALIYLIYRALNSRTR